jgi:hypothetical protein
MYEVRRTKKRGRSSQGYLVKPLRMKSSGKLSLMCFIEF